MKLIEIIRLFLRKPTNGFSYILDQPKSKYVFLFPVILGILYGISFAYNKSQASYLGSFLGSLLFSTIAALAITIFVFYAYCFIVFFISMLLGGTANIKMIFAVVSYSLIPIIIGFLVVFITKIILFPVVGLYEYALILTKFLNLLYSASFIISIVFLTIGNSIANQFSNIKSLVSSSSIIILILGYELFQMIK